MDKLITTDLVGAKKDKHPLTKERGRGRVKGFTGKPTSLNVWVRVLLHCCGREQTGVNDLRIPVVRIGWCGRDLIRWCLTRGGKLRVLLCNTRLVNVFYYRVSGVCITKNRIYNAKTFTRHLRQVFDPNYFTFRD